MLGEYYINLAIYQTNLKSYSNNLADTVNLTLVKQHEDHVDLDPESFICRAGISYNETIVVTGLAAGHVEITASSNSSDTWM